MFRTHQLSIASLLGLIAYCAATFASLKTSSPYWASALVSVTVLVLLGSVVACALSRDRAGWLGFALFGWGYFLMAFTSPFRDVVRPHLMTSVAIVESYRHLHPGVRVDVTDMTPLPGAGAPVGQSQLATGGASHIVAPQFAAVAGGGPLPIFQVQIGNGPPYPYVPAGPNRVYSFECSAHAAFTLVFAWIGWLFATFVAHQQSATSHHIPSPQP